MSFSAYMVGGKHYPKDGETIPFEGVLLNFGGAYNNVESVFTCPVTGVYFFTFSLYSANVRYTEYSYGDLFIDEVAVTSVLCGDNGSAYVYFQCSNSVVSHCLSGQRVRVVSASTAHNQMYGTEEYRSTTFSGFLVGDDAQPL